MKFSTPSGQELGSKLLIEVRISGTEFEEGGIDLEEGIRIGELIQDHLDILQVSAGMHNPKWMTWVHPCGFRPPMPNVCVAEAFKKTGKFHVPIVTLGAIDSLESAEQIIADGKADLVTMARSLIADHRADSQGHGRKNRRRDPLYQMHALPRLHRLRSPFSVCREPHRRSGSKS